MYTVVNLSLAVEHSTFIVSIQIYNKSYIHVTLNWNGKRVFNITSMKQTIESIRSFKSHLGCLTITEFLISCKGKV